MPIKIPDRSPAEHILSQEGVELIGVAAALRQDIRPLRILLLNLMPVKIATEVQLARLLSHTPLQIELTLLSLVSHVPKNTSIEHLRAFYRTLDEVRDEFFDGMIVTGAPVEHIAFEAVDYWAEFSAILDWAEQHVFRRYHICWGAQAALYKAFGIAKHPLRRKLFGVYRQTVLEPAAPLMRGFPPFFHTPVSRHTTIARRDVDRHAGLRVLAASRRTGPSLVDDRSTGDIYCFDHMEYDTDTLAREYERDVSRGLPIDAPCAYFADNDPSRDPINVWRPYGYLFVGNWIQQLYQDTPYVPAHIPEARWSGQRWAGERGASKSAALPLSAG
jgi:homoserine O-succinyltransferase